MSFEDDKNKSETNLWRELASGGNTTHYNAMAGYEISECLSAIINKELHDGTPIYPYI